MNLRKELEVLLNAITTVPNGLKLKIIGYDNTKGADKMLVGGDLQTFVEDAIKVINKLTMTEVSDHPAAENTPMIYFYNDSVWFKSSIIDGGGGAGSSVGATDLVESSKSNKQYLEDTNYANKYVSRKEELAIADSATVIPNSATTIYVKLINMGIEWDANLIFAPYAGKATKLYSLKPFTDGQFDVTRASTASYINEDGKIEIAGINMPRFDFSDGKPVLLTEDAGENLLTHPLTMSDFTKSGATLEGDPNTAGAELVTNGTFDTDTDWVKGTGWTISGGTVNFNGSAYGDNILQISTNAIFDSCFIVDYDIPVGSVDIKIYGFTVYSKKLTGSGSIYLFSGNSNNKISIRPRSDVISINSISVKEVQGFAAPSVDYPTGALKLVANSANGYIKSPVITITNGSDYANSIIIKRVKGTGAIYLSDINNTDIDIGTLTGHPLANGWMRYDKTEISTSTSGKIGVKLATSGDEILVAFPQLEQNSFASSWMFSGTEGTTSLRSADVVDLVNLQTNNILSDKWAISIKGTFKSKSTSYQPLRFKNNGVDVIVFFFNPNGTYQIRLDEDNHYCSWIGSDSINVLIKWDGVNITLFDNGLKIEQCTPTTFSSNLTELYVNSNGVELDISSIIMVDKVLSDGDCLTLSN